MEDKLNISESNLESNNEEKKVIVDNEQVEKKKKKKKRSKKTPKIQTTPPTIPIVDLYPNKDFPQGEIMDYKEEYLFKFVNIK